ncbi:ATP12 chaperone family protein [Asticcacaulis biprosthecium C19]|uniref:ATP12 chaperone family protein n=1 Tax=Asticcacaulis biprosthecium C19 TaxID=715226 RepID=F4QSR1_9CAUL|nr:ATP12 family protein [Asticcacaulis biprosthecium]EGF89781.1 ATP12 chaperone family protein [Asticcacaulis biprosthecium C19]
MPSDKPAKRADQLGHRPKRFWKEVTVTEGLGIALDGRPVKTPSGAHLVLPVHTLAHPVAAEWAAVGEHVDYDAMPLTRLGFAAIDRMPDIQDEIVSEVLRYAETDLICYPSEYPESLIAQEAELWDPVLHWARQDLGLEFHQNLTLIHRPQPAQTLERLQAFVRGMTPYEQAGLMSATPLLGSVVLAMALWHGHLTGEAAFVASTVGETFQAGIWGNDTEADQRRNGMKAQAVSLEIWFSGLR